MVEQRRTIDPDVCEGAMPASACASEEPQIPELFIVGSPRAHGRCAQIARRLASDAAAAFGSSPVAPEVISVAALRIHGCIGCDACKAALNPGPRCAVADETIGSSGGCADAGPNEAHVPNRADVQLPDVSRACIFDDDMPSVLDALARAEALTVVVPLYFAGPPSQFKALLDRLQPHFWACTRMAPKRPARLVVVGDGGDPFGADPLIAIVRSALAVAGFRVEAVELHVGADE